MLKMKKQEEGRKQEHGAEACHLRDKGDESGGWDCLEQGCSNPLQISGGGSMLGSATAGVTGRGHAYILLCAVNDFLFLSSWVTGPWHLQRIMFYV